MLQTDHREKGYLDFYMLFALLICVVYFGPKFSKWYGENEKKNTDKNGKIVRGYVTYFDYSKSGSHIELEYE